MSQQNVVFKVSTSSGFRRFSLSSGSSSFEELQQRLASIAARPSHTVTYIDEDGDDVVIGSDYELLEAIRVVRNASPDVNPVVIRLKLVFSDEPVSALPPSDCSLSVSTAGTKVACHVQNGGQEGVQVQCKAELSTPVQCKADLCTPVHLQSIMQPAAASFESLSKEQEQARLQHGWSEHMIPFTSAAPACSRGRHIHPASRGHQGLFGPQRNWPSHRFEQPPSEPASAPAPVSDADLGGHLVALLHSISSNRHHQGCFGHQRHWSGHRGNIFEPAQQQPSQPASSPALISDAELGGHLVALVHYISSSSGQDIAPMLMAIAPEVMSTHPHPYNVLLQIRNLMAHGGMFEQSQLWRECGIVRKSFAFKQQQQQQQLFTDATAASLARSVPSSTPPVASPSDAKLSREEQLIASGCPRPWAAAVVLAFGDNHIRVAEVLSSFPFPAAAAHVDVLVSMGFAELDARIALLHSSASICAALDILAE